MQPGFETDAARWQAVSRRDAAADGAFFYAVKSTGVYCRPACPSRLPKRDNTEFFASCLAAEQAGYRACLRCRPNASHPRRELAQRACRFIDAHLDEKLTLAQIGSHMGLSPAHLQRTFKDILGITPRQYQQAQRLGKFRQELHRGAPVAAATYAAGFAASSRLYASAKQLGMPPATYRNRGSGTAIRFTVFDSVLGAVLVAVAPKGVCRIALGDQAGALESELRAELAGADIARDDAGLKTIADKVALYLQGKLKSLDLPLDIRATAFQQSVWQLLQAIPYGETRSYSELAAQLGNPKAVRAVANACARNPLALLIPCHRVVQKDGSLAGFRWGLERKAALLAAERKKKS